MAKCAYTWKNLDPNAERGPDGKKIHPMHTCYLNGHGIKVDHKCHCGRTRPKPERNR